MFANVKYLATFMLATIAPFAANAATVSEIFSFDAKLVSGGLYQAGGGTGCIYDPTEDPELAKECPEFGDSGPVVNNMSVGETYKGQITLIYDLLTDTATPVLKDATCSLNGQNCLFKGEGYPNYIFGRPYQEGPEYGLRGPDVDLDLGTDGHGYSPHKGAMTSRFSISGGTGTYSFGTDYFPTGAGSYSIGAKFDLSNVSYQVSPTPAPVPLLASLPLLMGGVFGLGLLRKRSNNLRKT